MEDLHSSRIKARPESPKRVKRTKDGDKIVEHRYCASNEFWFTPWADKYMEKKLPDFIVVETPDCVYTVTVTQIQ